MPKKLIYAGFCAPNGKYSNHSEFVNRLTDNVFCSLKDVGLTHLFGFGYDHRKDTILKTFDLCEKYDIAYFPTLSSFEPYQKCLTDQEGKAFDDLDEKEIEALDCHFLLELSEYSSKKSFGGVFFSDEPGYLKLNGIAHAKKVFSKAYPDKEFHFNFFSYSINDGIFWGGTFQQINDVKLPFSLKGDMAITFPNRFHYYDVFVNHLLSQTHFEWVSYDKYAFETFWPDLLTSVHVALFELNAYFGEKSLKEDFSFYSYLQVGNFDGSKRQMTFAEWQLQCNVSLSYGAKGFAYFPCCFPLDWVKNPSFADAENGGSSLLDAKGEPTKFFFYAKKTKEFFSLFEDDLLSSRLLGVTAYGTYDNGYDKEFIKTLPDCECIFQGELPNILRYKEKSLSLSSDNELLVSTFVNGTKKRFFIINLSTTKTCHFNLKINGSYALYRMTESGSFENDLQNELNPGEGIYIKEL